MMIQPARRAGEPARLLLVSDDRALGQALLAAIGQPDAPLFDAKAIGGWEVVPAEAVVLLERHPDLSRTRRRLRFARSRVIVVAWPDQPRLVELVLREKGTVVTWPGSLDRLATELGRCLDDEDEVMAPERLAEELGQELARRLRRDAPHLRLADATRIEALVDKLACAVLEEAREHAATPIADLDWEHISTAVQTREESAIVRRRAAEGAPDRDPPRALESTLTKLPPPMSLPDPVSLMETGPYAPPSIEQLELLSHVEMIEDEDDAHASQPPPLPKHPSVPAVSLGRPPRAARAWAVVGAAIVLAIGAVATAAWTRSATRDHGTPPMAAPPRATLELGSPTVTPVIEPEAPPPALEAPAPEVPVAAPTSPEVRARRAAIRARSHRRQGRLERALSAARFATRLAPGVESHAALVAELEAELAAAPEAAPAPDPVTPEPESAILPE